MKESEARMEKVPFTMVLHKNGDWADTRFATMTVTLAKNPLDKCLVVVRRRTYQVASEDSRWEYEPVSDLWTDIETDIDSIDGGSSNEVIKDE